jgi:Alginate lyase/Pentapeptide repeats (8 copies)
VQPGEGERKSGGRQPQRLRRPQQPLRWLADDVDLRERSNPSDTRHHDTVEGDDLRTFSNEFFKLTPARDGIVFAANAGGVTTKNSDYPRSELREMNGVEEAAWSNTSGVHVLDVCEAVTEVPPGKPEVVAAQIHDGSDDVLQIRLEDKTLAVQYADGEQSVILDPAYRIGTPYRVRVVAEDSRVLVFYNGDQKAALPLSGDGWYYKLGAYVQSNPDKGGDAADTLGEVVVHSVRLTHSASASAGSSGDGVDRPSSTAPPSPADTGRDDEAEDRAEDDESAGAATPNTSADDDRTSGVTPRPSGKPDASRPRPGAQDADLTRADLTRADLTGSKLTDADLSEANLTGHRRARFPFRSANVRSHPLVTEVAGVRGLANTEAGARHRPGGTTRTGSWALWSVAMATLPSRISRTADCPRDPTTMTPAR